MSSFEAAWTDQNAVVIDNVMKTTGLSEEQAKKLMKMGDDHLDRLCDTALSGLCEPPKNVAITEG